MMVHQGAAAGPCQSPATAVAWPPAAWAPPLQGLDAVTPPLQGLGAVTPPPPPPPPPPGRKRKAEAQDNERLSKRLSLLNLEQNGSKVRVPVEPPSPGLDLDLDLDPGTVTRQQQLPAPCRSDHLDDTMHLDDSKHKVYIYNIDDELASSASSSDADADADDGRLVFLPHIEQHLRGNRIPPHVLASPDGELAGMQMVLYSDPRSLTVPEERDGVRRAILDARRRVREKQRQEREDVASPEMHLLHQSPETRAVDDNGDAMDMD